MPVTRRLPTLLFALALLALVPVGCGVGGAEVENVGCRQDSDCPGVNSMQCFDQRICVVRDLITWDVVMRVAPGPGSGLVEEHFVTTLDGMKPAASTWQLTTPARVRGRVKMAKPAASLNELIPGTLIATTPGALPGTKLRYTATSLLHPSSESGGSNAAPGKPAEGAGKTTEHSFNLVVAPGHAYDIAFWPQSTGLPPFYTQLTIGGDIDDLTVALPVAPDVITVSGRIVSRPTPAEVCAPAKGPVVPPACTPTTCTPIPQLQVALHDSAGRQRSTRVATDDKGAFTVTASADTDALWLAFDAPDPAGAANDRPNTADKQAAALPSGRFTARLDIAALRKSGKATVDLGDLDLGPLPTNYLLVREVLGDHGLSLPGARVHIHQDLPAPQRCAKDASSGGWKSAPAIDRLELRRSALTDSQGRVELRVLQATGAIRVQPPVTSSSAVWSHGPGQLSATADAIRCPARRKITGVTSDNRQRPIHGATVIVQPLPAPTDPERSLTPVFATSDAGARFELWLDPGRYAVIVEPPTDSGLARAVADVIEVKAPSNADSKAMDIALTVVPPTVLFGHVLGAGGSPLSGVLIDVLAPGIKQLVEASDGEPGKPGGEAAAISARARLVRQQTHLLGSVVTDSDGRFEILVAPGQLAD